LSYQDIPLLGFAPDNDPAQPGSFVSCVGYESTTRGWKLARDVTSTGTLAYAPLVISRGFVSNRADGLELVYMASTTGVHGDLLYRKSAGTVINVSSGLYNGFDFTFCQYGNYTIAVNLSDVAQQRDASTETNLFADSVATAIPKAAVCFTWGPPTAPRVMFLNYNDGTAYVDGWWSSHKGGPTLAWTADIATEAANGRLLGAGTLVAGYGFKDDAIAFSDREMWQGTYVGPPFVVEWHKIAADIGCVGPQAVCSGNNTLYFVGKQGLYYFDGSYPRKLQVPMQRWLVDQLAGATKTDYTTLAFDAKGQRLLLTLRSSSQPYAVTYYLSINLLTRAVGQLPLTNGQGTIRVPLANKYTWQTSGSNTVLAQEGSSPITTTTSYIELNRVRGPDARTPTDVTTFRRLLPRFAVAPTSFGAAYAGAKAMSDTFSFTALTTNSASPWWSEPFDQTTATANRWHGLRVYTNSNGTADPELVGVDAEFADTVSRY
jgi:hypothetical protein